MSDSYYPRVLIVGQSFDSFTGTGITLTNLFRGWPKDRLAAAAAREDFSDTTVCERYYRLGALEDYWVWPFSFIPREGKRSGPVVQAASEASAGTPFSCASPGSGQRGRLKALFYAVLDSLCAHDLMRRLRLSPQFMDWVRDFQPDIIYSMLSSLSLIRLVDDLVEATGKPLVIQTLDDWPAWIYGHGLLSPSMRRRTDVELRALFKKAALRYTHSPGMREAFEARYHLPFVPFHNLVDLERWEAFFRREWTVRSPFRLLYAGRIGEANSTSLADICRCVDELQQQGLDIVIDLYSPNHADPLVHDLGYLAGVSVHSPVPHQEIQDVMVNSDLLVLPLDFDQESILFARYSIPSKMVDYMASGVPLLVCAPAEMACSQYVRQEKCGYVASENTMDAFKSAIIRLAGDESLRRELAQRARAVAVQNHDARKVRESFRHALVEVSIGS